MEFYLRARPFRVGHGVVRRLLADRRISTEVSIESAELKERQVRSCLARGASFATSCQAALHGCLPADPPRTAMFGSRFVAAPSRRQTRCGSRLLACSRTLFVSPAHCAAVLARLMLLSWSWRVLDPSEENSAIVGIDKRRIPWLA